MPIIVKTKTSKTGTVTPSDLNVETTVFEITAQGDDYLVEGYIDLSALQSGDQVVIKEYIAVDGTNYRLFSQVTLDGPVSEPIIRFHTKMFVSTMKYKVTITQTQGTVRSFPYGYILEVLGEM